MASYFTDAYYEMKRQQLLAQSNYSPLLGGIGNVGIYSMASPAPYPTPQEPQKQEPNKKLLLLEEKED